VLRGYQDRVFERFWKRELDIEDPAVVAAVLAEAGADTTGFAAWLTGDGPAALAACCRDAEDKGVFGVPSFILDGELFWGSEHLPDIRAKLVA
jgi:2-hydroxychromene-2-carboxylate isomerase